jgi:hypothetical protein
MLGRLVRTGLTLYPMGLGAIPSPPYDVVARLGSKDDIHRYCIDLKVKDFIDKRPEDWRRLLQRWSKVDLAAIGPAWDDLREAIQKSRSSSGASVLRSRLGQLQTPRLQSGRCSS